jgi:hypothetical protein
MANERQRPINQQLRTSLLFEPRRVLIAIGRAASLRDAVRGGDVP